MTSKPLWVLAALLAVLAGTWLVFPHALARNLRRLEALRSGALQLDAPGDNCPDRWWALASAVRRGAQPGGAQWEAVMACGRVYVQMALALREPDLPLVELALKHHPKIVKWWVLKGDLLWASDPAAAGAAYARAVTISPYYALGWCRVGRTFENLSADYRQAQEAYLKCCEYGDPGKHGCYGAGRMMEQLGDPLKAIEYYRLSRWEGALRRADELERELSR